MRPLPASDVADFHRQVEERMRELFRRHNELPVYQPPTYRYNPSIRLRRFEDR